jgi:hypothetical protein
MEHNLGYGFKSMAERVGFNKPLPVRNTLGSTSGRAICRTAGPEKTDRLAKGLPGFGSTKVLTASRVATVHVSTLLALSQELVARA